MRENSRFVEQTQGRASMRDNPVSAFCVTAFPTRDCILCAAWRLPSQGKRRDHFRHAFCLFSCLTNASPQRGGCIHFLPGVGVYASRKRQRMVSAAVQGLPRSAAVPEHHVAVPAPRLWNGHGARIEIQVVLAKAFPRQIGRAHV